MQRSVPGAQVSTGVVRGDTHLSEALLNDGVVSLRRIVHSRRTRSEFGQLLGRQRERQHRLSLVLPEL